MVQRAYLALKTKPNRYFYNNRIDKRGIPHEAGPELPDAFRRRRNKETHHATMMRMRSFAVLPKSKVLNMVPDANNEDAQTMSIKDLENSEEGHKRLKILKPGKTELAATQKMSETDKDEWYRQQDDSTISDLCEQSQSVPGYYNRSPVARVWLQNDEYRRDLKGIVFRPDKTPGINPDGYFNTWDGFAVKPQDGDWSLIRRHIEEVVCDGCEELSVYLLKWLAFNFQFPERMTEICIVVRGAEGCGKGVIFDTLMRRVMGRKYALTLDKGREISADFNSILGDKLYVCIDESNMGGDKGASESLKFSITNSYGPVRTKHVDTKCMPSYKNFVVLCNPDSMPVSVTAESRRFVYVNPSDKYAGDHSSNAEASRYFDLLWQQVDDPRSQSAFLKDMLDMELTHWKPQRVPHVEGGLKKDLLLEGDMQKSGVMSFWYDKLRKKMMLSLSEQPHAAPSGDDDWRDLLCDEAYKEEGKLVILRHVFPTEKDKAKCSGRLVRTERAVYSEYIQFMEENSVATRKCTQGDFKKETDKIVGATQYRRPECSTFKMTNTKEGPIEKEVPRPFAYIFLSLSGSRERFAKYTKFSSWGAWEGHDDDADQDEAQETEDEPCPKRVRQCS